MSETFPVRWWLVVGFGHKVEQQLAWSVLILLYCLNLVELHFSPTPVSCLEVFKSRVEHVKEGLYTKKVNKIMPLRLT